MAQLATLRCSVATKNEMWRIIPGCLFLKRSELSRERPEECDRNLPLSVSSVTFCQHFSWEFRSLILRIKAQYGQYACSFDSQQVGWDSLLGLNSRNQGTEFSSVDRMWLIETDNSGFLSHSLDLSLDNSLASLKYSRISGNPQYINLMAKFLRSLKTALSFMK